MRQGPDSSHPTAGRSGDLGPVGIAGKHLELGQVTTSLHVDKAIVQIGSAIGVEPPGAPLGCARGEEGVRHRPTLQAARATRFGMCGSMLNLRVGSGDHKRPTR
jgi:hypothetical protein